jgi:hypothetical protein
MFKYLHAKPFVPQNSVENFAEKDLFFIQWIGQNKDLLEDSEQDTKYWEEKCRQSELVNILCTPKN